MTPDRTGNHESPVFSLLTSHWLSTIGSALVTIAGCSWLFLLPLHAGGEASNPYLGILIFFVIPLVFFAGLALIPMGAWFARRRIRAGLQQPQTRRVALRRLAIFFGSMTVINVAIGSQVTYRAVTQMETKQFCGQSCHVMKPQFTANRQSTHRGVGCVDCHVVPGAAGFLHAKMNGTRQLIEVTLNNFPRPVPPALETNRLASSEETCETCHARTLDSGSKLRVISKFRDDEASTPVSTVLMMNTGEIHRAHMGAGIEIRYRAADAKRRQIPWAEVRNRNTGETRTYTAGGAKSLAGHEFTMQCADCHNRVGHDFESPEQAVDGAMAAGRIPVGLPFAHKTATAVLRTNTADSIQGAFANFYRQKYPDIALQRARDINAAGKAVAALYEDNVFPDLRVGWGTYSTNLGHADNFGCFRCHDENHATAEKKTISQDCTVCHNALAVEEPSPDVLKSLGLDRKFTMLLKH